MTNPDLIEQDIKQTRAALNEVTEELASRAKTVVNTARPDKSPLPWGRWLAVAAGGFFAACVGLLMLRR